MHSVIGKSLSVGKVVHKVAVAFLISGHFVFPGLALSQKLSFHNNNMLQPVPEFCIPALSGWGITEFATLFFCLATVQLSLRKSPGGEF